MGPLTGQSRHADVHASRTFPWLAGSGDDVPNYNDSAMTMQYQAVTSTLWRRQTRTGCVICLNVEDMQNF